MPAFPFDAEHVGEVRKVVGRYELRRRGTTLDRLVEMLKCSDNSLRVDVEIDVSRHIQFLLHPRSTSSAAEIGAARRPRQNKEAAAHNERLTSERDFRTYGTEPEESTGL